MRDSNAWTPVCWNSVRLPFEITPNGDEVTVPDEALGGAMFIRLFRLVSLEIFRPPSTKYKGTPMYGIQTITSIQATVALGLRFSRINLEMRRNARPKPSGGPRYGQMAST